MNFPIYYFKKKNNKIVHIKLFTFLICMLRSLAVKRAPFVIICANFNFSSFSFNSS